MTDELLRPVDKHFFVSTIDALNTIDYQKAFELIHDIEYEEDNVATSDFPILVLDNTLAMIKETLDDAGITVYDSISNNHALELIQTLAVLSTPNPALIEKLRDDPVDTLTALLLIHSETIAPIFSIDEVDGRINATIASYEKLTDETFFPTRPKLTNYMLEKLELRDLGNLAEIPIRLWEKHTLYMNLCKLSGSIDFDIVVADKLFYLAVHSVDTSFDDAYESIEAFLPPELGAIVSTRYFRLVDVYNELIGENHDN